MNCLSVAPEWVRRAGLPPRTSRDDHCAMHSCSRFDWADAQARQTAVQTRRDAAQSPGAAAASVLPQGALLRRPPGGDSHATGRSSPRDPDLLGAPRLARVRLCSPEIPRSPEILRSPDPRLFGFC